MGIDDRKAHPRPFGLEVDGCVVEGLYISFLHYYDSIYI